MPFCMFVRSQGSSSADHQQNPQSSPADRFVMYGRTYSIAALQLTEAEACLATLPAACNVTFCLSRRMAVQEKESLLAACSAQQGLQWQIHVAVAGESLDASSGSSSYQVHISDQLLKQLHFRSMRNYQVAWLNAEVCRNSDRVRLITWSGETASMCLVP